MNPWEQLPDAERLHTLAGITPRARPYFETLLAEARARNMRPYIVSALRTCAEQDGTTSAVRGCHSWHVFGRAVDIQLQSPAGQIDDITTYAALGAWWEKQGGIWGGRWTGLYGPQGDYMHFQWAPEYGTSVPASICGAGDCGSARMAFLTHEWTLSGSGTLSPGAAAVGVAIVATLLGGTFALTRRVTRARRRA